MTETYHINELKHWGLSKGQQAPNHKYIARIETGDAKSPYRYFYTQAEYDMYLANKQREQGAIETGKKVSEGISSLANKFNKMVNNVASKDPHGEQFLRNEKATQNIGSDYGILKNKTSDYLDAVTARKERANYNQKFSEVFGDNGGKDYKNMNERVKNRSEALERQHSLSSEPNKVYNEKAEAYVDNSVNSMKISEADYQKERRRMDALERAADDYDKANRITTSVKRIIATHKKYKNMKHTDDYFDAMVSSDTVVNDDYLAHYGRKGMKWYQRIFSGSKSMAKGTAKLGVRKVGDKVQDKTTTRGHQESDSVTKDQATAMKNAAMRSGDPRMIAKYGHLMDNKEFQAAISRMGEQQKLNAALKAQNKTIFDNVKDLTDKGNTIVNAVDTAVKLKTKYDEVNKMLSSKTGRASDALAGKVADKIADKAKAKITNVEQPTPEAPKKSKTPNNSVYESMAPKTQQNYDWQSAMVNANKPKVKDNTAEYRARKEAWEAALKKKVEEDERKRYK